MFKIHKTSNSDVVLYAKHFKNADGYGACWTRHDPQGIRRGGYNIGILPRRLQLIMVERADFITQVIYSYLTPIAWFDSQYGAWVVPDVSYSVTTAHHTSSLWKLVYPEDDPRSIKREKFVSVPSDVSLEEYLRVIQGKMIFTRTGTLPGPNFVLEK